MARSWSVTGIITTATWVRPVAVVVSGMGATSRWKTVSVPQTPTVSETHRSVQPLVRGEREELDELVSRQGHGLEDLARFLGPALALEPLVVADLRPDLLELRGLQLAHELRRDRPPVLQLDAVADPLPDLRARDLRGRRVLHEAVDRRRAVAAQPRRDVLDADVDVVAQPLLGDRARRRGEVEQLVAAHLDVGALAVELVGTLAEHRVEGVHRRRHEVGVRDPRAVEAVAR